MTMRHFVTLLFVVGLALAQEPRDISALIEPYLLAGQLEQARQELDNALIKTPELDDARFALGLVTFLQSIEHVIQNFHRYGLYSDRAATFGLPILRLPTPRNDAPETISYQDFRSIFETFYQDLTKVAVTLEQVEGEVNLPMRFGQIRLDLDDDGLATEEERFWYIFTQYNQQAAFLEEQGELDTEAKDFRIAFDKGDVHWLLGYSHLLMAMCDFYLAHDGQTLFDSTAHLFYPKVETPHGFLAEQGNVDVSGVDLAFAMDVISFIHLVRLEVTSPERMANALTHLEAVITQSHLSWQAIESETDNNREWIPNARQQSVIPAIVTEEQIAGWLDFLDEADALLEGEKLIPYWRVQDERGINLNKVFLEPSTFDLILWIQGSAATPYLEEGTLTTRETWQEFQRVFGGNFLGFALWFN
jgi:hypothetical protein